jgi:hypothetical protein
LSVASPRLKLAADKMVDKPVTVGQMPLLTELKTDFSRFYKDVAPMVLGRGRQKLPAIKVYIPVDRGGQVYIL